MNNKEKSLAERGADLFDETVIALYDAATDVSKWLAFLERMGDLFEAPVTQVIYYDFELDELTFRVHRGLEHFPPEIHQRYIELSREDPFVLKMMEFPGKPMLISDRYELESSAIYKEILAPLGIGGFRRSLAVHLEPSAFLGMARWARSPSFDDEDVATLGRLAPHLKRAFALHRQFALLDMSQQNALASLDALPLGIVLTDADGRPRQTNQTAREIAARGDGLLLTRDMISAHRREDAAQLLEAVRNAVQGALNGVAPPAQAISVTRRDGNADYPVVVSAIWANPQRFGLGHLERPLAALFVTDPDRPQEASADLLQRLFGLTAAEAAVTELLVAGKTLSQVAAALGVTRNTVRTHLKRVFSKTDTDRQAELVRKIMGTPIWTAALERQKNLGPQLPDKNR